MRLRPLDPVAASLLVVLLLALVVRCGQALREALALAEAESARRADAEQIRLQREMIDRLSKVREDDLLKKMHPRRPMAGPRAAVTSK